MHHLNKNLRIGDDQIKQLFDKLIDAGFDINQKNKDGETVLMNGMNIT